MANSHFVLPNFINCLIHVFQHSCIYVKRAGKFKEDKAKHQLDLVARKNTPVSIVYLFLF